MTDELKPCPFCGGDPTEHAIEPHTHAMTLGDFKMPDHEGSHVIECACGAGFVGDTREAAATRWNTRALTAAQPAQTDSMGMPTSCGKPLCSPDEHHPLCKLHQPAAQATPEPVRLGALMALTAERDKLNAALQIACSHLTDEQAAQVAAAMPQQAAGEPVGEARCSTCGVTMNELHHPACGAVTAAIIGLNTMAAQDKEARRRELAEKIRETLRGVFTHPAPGVPEGWAIERRTDMSPTALVVRSPKNGPGFLTVENNHANIAYRMLYRLASDLLAAAQAKGADK